VVGDLRAIGMGKRLAASRSRRSAVGLTDAEGAYLTQAEAFKGECEGEASRNSPPST